MHTSFVNSDYAQFFKHGRAFNEEYKVTITNSSATLRTPHSHVIAHSRYTLHYLNLEDDVNLQIFVDCMQHYGIVDVLSLPLAVDLISIMLDDIYTFAKSLHAKLDHAASKYASWYLTAGRNKQSSKGVYSRWVTKHACKAILGCARFAVVESHELVEFSDSVHVNSFDKLFSECGVKCTLDYTIRVLPSVAVLTCNEQCLFMPANTTIKFEYMDITKNLNQPCIVDWGRHFGSVEAPTVEDAICIIRGVMEEVYWIAQRISSTYGKMVPEYAAWYMDVGRFMPSNLNAHLRRVTEMACSALREDVVCSTPSKFTLFE